MYFIGYLLWCCHFIAFVTIKNIIGLSYLNSFGFMSKVSNDVKMSNIKVEP